MPGLDHEPEVESSINTAANWIVLAVAVVIAAAVWLVWVNFGIFAVHRTVANEVTVALSSAPASPATVASAGAGSSGNASSIDDRRAARLAEIGQVGDAFGGLNTALTALAGALVFWAGYMQLQTLKHAREQADIERSARQKQASDTLKTVEIAERTAKSAEEANRLARDSYIAAQRAWVKCEIMPSGPLEYNADGLTLTVDLRMTNIGNSPALNVVPDIKIQAPAVGFDDHFDERAITQKMSEQLRAYSHAQSPFGFTIFPNETVVQRMTVSMPNDEVMRVTKISQAIYIVLFSVTQYRLVIEDGLWHQTTSVHDVRRMDIRRAEAMAKNRSQTAIFVDDGLVPLEQLQLIGSVLSPTHAD